MNSVISKQYRNLKIIRFIARLISTLAAAFLLIIVIGEIIFNTVPVTWEGMMIAGFVVLLAVSVFIAWLKEGIGGIILIILAISYAVFIYFSAGRNKILAALLITAPFLISGILFCVYSYKKSK